LKSNVSSRSIKQRMKELEKVSTRIDAKMVRLERIITKMSKSL
jgi:hypothetical protein